MFSHYAYFDDLVEKMLRGDYDQHMREAWVWMQGRFVPYPFQNNIHRLPRTSSSTASWASSRPSGRTIPHGTFADVDHRGVREGIARHFMRPYNFKVWAHPLELMASAGTATGYRRRRPPDPREPPARARRRRVGPEQQVPVPAERRDRRDLSKNRGTARPRGSRPAASSSRSTPTGGSSGSTTAARTSTTRWSSPCRSTDSSHR